MHNIDKLTQLTAELEGLLHVMNRRDSESLRALIRDKYTEFTTRFDEFLESLANDKVQQAELDLQFDEHEVAQLEAKEQEAESSEIEDEMTASVAAVERDDTQIDEEPFISEDFDITAETPEKVEDAVRAEVAVRAEYAPAAKTTESTPVEEAEYNFESDINEFESDNSGGSHQKEEEVNEPYKARYNEPEISSVLKVDQMLSRKEAADLKRVFTLNDKFRFRRALFDQDDSKFARALAELSDLTSFEDAKRLVTEKYGWDIENPDVEDFLLIIKPHYE